MRGYVRLHRLFGEDKKVEEFFGVEKFVRGCKTHRCTLDQDFAFVGAA